MTEPRIQYAKTKDGVSIAFYTLGEGMPLVSIPLVFSHIQLQWQDPHWRRWNERLAQGRRLVAYDGRGSGLSERTVADYSLDALVLDLEAVVDRLELGRFALLGLATWGPVAIAYAARHPERVSHLLLWCSYARGSDWAGSSQLQTILRLTDNWELFTETLAHTMAGWERGEEAHGLAAYYRACITPQAAQSAIRASMKIDVTALLPRVKSPTLVLHRRQIASPDVDVATGLASGIPDARLALLEGEAVGPWLGDTDAVLEAIDEFLSEGKEVSAGEESVEPGAFRTILFTDIEGSTTRTQRLGDAKAQELIRTHNAIVRDALKAHSGTETKHTGDGIMASFTSASAALEAAVAIQKALADHNEGNPDAAIGVRIGLNAGEPVAEDKDLFGTAVQLARRICDHAGASEILVSSVVRELAAGKHFVFADRGEFVAKGFDEAVRVYEVRWREEV